MKSNLAQQQSNDNSDFLPGDVVVFINEDMPDHLMTVTKVNRYSVLLDDGIKFAMNHLIRAASIAELRAKRRLDTPVALFVSGVP